MTDKMADYLSGFRGIDVSVEVADALTEYWDGLQKLRPASRQDTTDEENIPVTFDPTAGGPLG